jgi:two-component sensor histidine kinase
MSTSLRAATATAVVEAPVGDGGLHLTPSLVPALLDTRLRQQEILAELGVQSLQGIPFDDLLVRTVELAAEGLNAEFCKVMEHMPNKGVFLVRAGVGWGSEVVGHATVGADLASPAGFALRTGKPVISNHLEHEKRFRTPELLARYGIRRAMNVILKGTGDPFGVLEVDSRSAGEFTEHDLTFLQGTANILGMAIERQRMEGDLRAAVDAHKVLMTELNHRVKNSLQLVATMLSLQAGATADEAARHDLQEATGRVMAIARAHESLYRDSRIETIDLGRYISDVCRDLDQAIGRGRVQVTAPEGIFVPTDRAVPIALIVNELVTNALKYAYGERSDGVTFVRLESGEDRLTISVRDEGVGLPEGFNPAQGKGLGMRITRTLASQLDAALEVRNAALGAEFVLSVPRHSPNGNGRPK